MELTICKHPLNYWRCDALIILYPQGLLTASKRSWEICQYNSGMSSQELQGAIFKKKLDNFLFAQFRFFIGAGNFLFSQSKLNPDMHLHLHMLLENGLDNYRVYHGVFQHHQPNTWIVVTCYAEGGKSPTLAALRPLVRTWRFHLLSSKASTSWASSRHIERCARIRHRAKLSTYLLRVLHVSDAVLFQVIYKD